MRISEYRAFLFVMLSFSVSQHLFSQETSRSESVFFANDLTFRVPDITNWNIEVLTDNWSSDSTWNVEYNYDIDKQELGGKIYIQLKERTLPTPQIDDRNIGDFGQYNVSWAPLDGWNGYRISYDGKKEPKCRNCGLFFRIVYVYYLSDRHNLYFTFVGHGPSSLVDTLVADFEKSIQPFFIANESSLDHFILFNEPAVVIKDSLVANDGIFYFNYNRYYEVINNDAEESVIELLQSEFLVSPLRLTIHRRPIESETASFDVDLTELYKPLHVISLNRKIEYVTLTPTQGSNVWSGQCGKHALPYMVKQAVLESFIAKKYRDSAGKLWEYSFAAEVKVVDGSSNFYYLRVLKKYIDDFEEINHLTPDI